MRAKPRENKSGLARVPVGPQWTGREEFLFQLKLDAADARRRIIREIIESRFPPPIHVGTNLTIDKTGPSWKARYG